MTLLEPPRFFCKLKLLTKIMRHQLFWLVFESAEGPRTIFRFLPKARTILGIGPKARNFSSPNIRMVRGYWGLLVVILWVE